MVVKYNDLRAIRDKKKKVVSRSSFEDNKLIAVVDAIRLDALNTVRVVLNM